MAGVAVVFMGALWYEDWRVRRIARRRQLARCGLCIVTSGDAWDVQDATSTELEASLRRALFVGDLALAYRERFETRRDRTESPFQIRRGRVQAAERRFDKTLDAVDRAAERWLVRQGGDDARRRRAVEQLLEYLVHGGKARGGRAVLEQTIEVLEQTIAVWHTTSRDQARLHPFR